MTNRRQFVSYSLPSLIALAISCAADAETAHLEESDATAAALGYKQDASKVDIKKSPSYVKGHACSNCQLYQGKATDAAGACAVMGGKLVNANGWCNAWAKKT